MNVYQTEGSLGGYHLPAFKAWGGGEKGFLHLIMPSTTPKPAAEKSLPQYDLNGRPVPMTPVGFAFNRFFIQDLLREQMGLQASTAIPGSPTRWPGAWRSWTARPGWRWLLTQGGSHQRLPGRARGQGRPMSWKPVIAPDRAPSGPEATARNWLTPVRGGLTWGLQPGQLRGRGRNLPGLFLGNPY